MAKRNKGVVLSDELFRQYYAFKSKQEFDERKHDRYIDIDGKIEILLSSGFDHLALNDKDFAYVIRPVEKSRFGY